MSLDIGKKLKTLRLEKELSQADMSAKLGVSVRFYQDIEQGRKEPSLTNLSKMLDMIKLTPAQFFGLELPKVSGLELISLIEPILELGRVSPRKSALIFALLASDPSYLKSLNETQASQAKVLLKAL